MSTVHIHTGLVKLPTKGRENTGSGSVWKLASSQFNIQYTQYNTERHSNELQVDEAAREGDRPTRPGIRTNICTSDGKQQQRETIRATGEWKTGKSRNRRPLTSPAPSLSRALQHRRRGGSKGLLSSRPAAYSTDRRRASEPGPGDQITPPR